MGLLMIIGIAARGEAEIDLRSCPGLSNAALAHGILRNPDGALKRIPIERGNLHGPCRGTGNRRGVRMTVG